MKPATEKRPRTHLFTIRIWAEKLEGGLLEWRGKVHNVTKGESVYFRGWRELMKRLQEMLPEEDET